MSKSIEGVPESITREQYLGLIASVGLEPTALRSLRFATDGIYAVVFALDDQGRKMIDATANEVATHEVYIPVSDHLSTRFETDENRDRLVRP